MIKKINYSIIDTEKKLEKGDVLIIIDSSPENMSFWQLIFILYKFKNDGGAKLHFESALINFYYGYQLSKLPNFKIHGYMGQLGKHHRLIKRIERVLFN